MIINLFTCENEEHDFFHDFRILQWKVLENGDLIEKQEETESVLKVNFHS